MAASQGITIRREQKEDGTVFNGTMFTVAGQGSELQFSVKDGSDLTVDGSNGKGEEEPSEGSLADVSDSGAFGISAGVTLTGNNTTAKGGAVSNNGGSIVLKGGTITGKYRSHGSYLQQYGYCRTGHSCHKGEYRGKPLSGSGCISGCDRCADRFLHLSDSRSSGR